MLNLVTVVFQGIVNDFFELGVFALAIGHVGGKHQFRAAGLDAIAQRLSAKAGKYHGVDRADAHRRQHQDDGLWTGGHVNGEAIALVDAHAAQGRGHPLHFMQ